MTSKSTVVIIFVVSFVLLTSCSTVQQGGGIGGTGAKDDCQKENPDSTHKKDECINELKL